MTTTDAAKDAAKVPHYMLPNFTSILPEYANAEQDKIREVRWVLLACCYKLLIFTFLTGILNRKLCSCLQDPQ